MEPFVREYFKEPEAATEPRNPVKALAIDILVTVLIGQLTVPRGDKEAQKEHMDKLEEAIVKQIESFLAQRDARQ